MTADDPNVVEIVGSSEAKLDRLGRKLDALDSHLQLSAARRASILQCRLDAARDTVSRVRAWIESQSAVPSAVARELRDAVAGLDRQLSGSADAAMRRPAGRRDRIAAAGAALEGALAAGAMRAGRQTDATSRHAETRYRRAMEDLDTELEIAEACHRLLAPYRGRERSDRRQALRADIAGLQERLEASRRRLADHRRRTAVDRRRLDLAMGGDVDAVAAALDRWLR